eukprot:COSAG04_NODE_517_length_13186_cov_7.434248_16_plen_121_part_00
MRCCYLLLAVLRMPKPQSHLVVRIVAANLSVASFSVGVRYYQHREHFLLVPMLSLMGVAALISLAVGSSADADPADGSQTAVSMPGSLLVSSARRATQKEFVDQAISLSCCMKLWSVILI